MTVLYNLSFIQFASLGEGKINRCGIQSGHAEYEEREKFNSINVAIGASGLHVTQINQEPFKGTQNVDPS